MHHSSRSLLASLGWVWALGLAACSDEPSGPVSDTCQSDTECSSGLCYAQVCLEPEEDSDGDGLINEVETRLGTNPLLADSDADGVLDSEEIGSITTPRDSDNDGTIDALESSLIDSDADCIHDEVDESNKLFSSYGDPRALALCPSVGVCASSSERLALSCEAGLDSPTCDFRGVPYYQADESLCDGLDNDCDGLVDEGCGLVHQGLLGYWRLDGNAQDSGPFATHGTLSGALTPTADRFGQAGQAMSFEGLGLIEVPASRHPLTGDLSYTFWVKPSLDALSSASGPLSFGELEANLRSGVLLDAHGCLSHTRHEASTQAERVCAPAGHWSFLALVQEGSTLRAYLDSQLLLEVSDSAPITLRRTLLTLGASRQLANGTLVEPFHGTLDEMRLYGRALSQEELRTLFHEGNWEPKGSPANPARSCEHVRDAAGATTSGLSTLDIDGEGPSPAFEAYCDQEHDGGGWTLAWTYGFTEADAFTSASNAISPRPSWPAVGADVPISEDAPSLERAGAIPWEHWEALGVSFKLATPDGEALHCEVSSYDEGSLSTGLEGPVSCVSTRATRPCSDLPDWVFFWDLGPGLSASDLFFYFEGSRTENWPTHDACGAGQAPAGPLQASRGHLFLRGRAY